MLPLSCEPGPLNEPPPRPRSSMYLKDDEKYSFTLTSIKESGEERKEIPSKSEAYRREILTWDILNERPLVRHWLPRCMQLRQFPDCQWGDFSSNRESIDLKLASGAAIKQKRDKKT